VVLLTLAYFASTNANYGILMWLPKILKSASGASTLAVSAMSAVPFLVAVPVGLWLSFHSDKTRERKWHGALISAAGALALFVLPLALDNPVAAVPLFAVAVTGVYSQKGPFWAIATTLLGGKAKAASVGLINSLGNLGGFVGPYTVGHLMTRSSSYAGGVLYLAGCLSVCAVLIFIAGRSAERAQQQRVWQAAASAPPTRAAQAD
jgi:ACS family tartrate transporter-like MFS transporter